MSTKVALRAATTLHFTGKLGEPKFRLTAHRESVAARQVALLYRKLKALQQEAMQGMQQHQPDVNIKLEAANRCVSRFAGFLNPTS